MELKVNDKVRIKDKTRRYKKNYTGKVIYKNNSYFTIKSQNYNTSFSWVDIIDESISITVLN